MAAGVAPFLTGLAWLLGRVRKFPAVPSRRAMNVRRSDRGHLEQARVLPGRLPARVRLVTIPVEAMTALVEGELQTAVSRAGVNLPPFFLQEAWLWRIRIEQLKRDPGSAGWVVQAVLTDPGDVVVGHAGFHGPPDEERMVEVAYTVIPEHRRRGFARAAVLELLPGGR